MMQEMYGIKEYWFHFFLLLRDPWKCDFLSVSEVALATANIDIKGKKCYPFKDRKG